MVPLKTGNTKTETSEEELGLRQVQGLGPVLGLWLGLGLGSPRNLKKMLEITAAGWGLGLGLWSGYGQG